MIEISIQSQLSEIENDLKDLNLCLPKFSSKALKKVTTAAASKMKSGYKKSGLRVKTGALYKGIYHKVKGETGFVGEVSKQAYKFIPQSYGMEIKAKKDYLNFCVNGQWVKVKSVQIPAKNLLEAAQQYVDSPKMMEDIEKVLEREIGKLYK